MPSSPFISNLGLNSLQDLLHRVTRTQVIIVASTVVVTIPIFRHYREDYRKWYSLGKGGVPRNLLGYAFTKYLTSKGSKDVDSTVRYVEEGDQSVLEGTSFFEGTVPIREGPRPNISEWAAPVRQLSAMAPEDVKQKLFAAILAVANSIPTIEIRYSEIEGRTHSSNALHVVKGEADASRRFATRGPTEFYHIHPAEGSAHTIVSAADAKILIERGWSERHPLSGCGTGGFPSTYIHVYAPRTEEEIAVHEMIAKAGARYASQKNAL